MAAPSELSVGHSSCNASNVSQPGTLGTRKVVVLPASGMESYFEALQGMGVCIAQGPLQAILPEGWNVRTPPYAKGKNVVFIDHHVRPRVQIVIDKALIVKVLTADEGEVARQKDEVTLALVKQNRSAVWSEATPWVLGLKRNGIACVHGYFSKEHIKEADYSLRQLANPNDEIGYVRTTMNEPRLMLRPVVNGFEGQFDPLPEPTSCQCL